MSTLTINKLLSPKAKKRMERIVLTEKMPSSYGGRPMKLGKLELNRGLVLFLGYHPITREKVYIRPEHLGKFFEEAGGDYKINIQIKSEDTNFEKLANFFRPQEIKESALEGLTS